MRAVPLPDCRAILMRDAGNYSVSKIAGVVDLRIGLLDVWERSGPSRA